MNKENTEANEQNAKSSTNSAGPRLAKLEPINAELLEALERISTAYDETLRHPIASQLLQAIYRARAAIAKAKGGAA